MTAKSTKSQSQGGSSMSKLQRTIQLESGLCVTESKDT
jgi:hypothetical protein